MPPRLPAREKTEGESVNATLSRPDRAADRARYPAADSATASAGRPSRIGEKEKRRAADRRMRRLFAKG